MIKFKRGLVTYRNGAANTAPEAEKMAIYDGIAEP